MNISPNLLIAFLMKTSLFEDFTREQIQEFLPHFKVDQVRPGRPVFEEGSVGDAWYVLFDGGAIVTRTVDFEAPRELARLVPSNGSGGGAVEGTNSVRPNDAQAERPVEDGAVPTPPRRWLRRQNFPDF